MNLPQQKNVLKVTGTLKSKYLDHRNYNNQDNIVGNVVIQAKENDKIQNYRINIFTPEKTKSGKPMPSYKSVSALETWHDLDHFQDGTAARINVTGSLDYNIFTDKNDQTRKNLRLSGDFFSRIKEGSQDETDGAKAEMVVSVDGYHDEIKNGEPTGNKTISNLNVGYNNRINRVPNLKFDMNLLGENIEDIMNTFPVGSSMLIDIKLNNYAEKTKSVEQAHGFGKKAQIGTATRFVRNNLIQFVSIDKPQGVLSEQQFNKAKKLLSDRENPQSDVNKKMNSYNPMNNKSNDVELSDDDIPF